VSLRSLKTIPWPQACPDAMRSYVGCSHHGCVNRCSRAVSFTGWTLRFKQSSLHPGDRASTGVGPSGFIPPCLPNHATFPSSFRLQVGLVAQESHAHLLPRDAGIKRRRDAAHTSRSATGSRGLERRTRRNLIRVAGLLQLIDTVHVLNGTGGRLSQGIARSRGILVSPWLWKDAPSGHE
jgi:hypothetical protein